MPETPLQQPANAQTPKQSYSRVVKNQPLPKERKRIPGFILLLLFLAAAGAVVWVIEARTEFSIIERVLGPQELPEIIAPIERDTPEPDNSGVAENPTAKPPAQADPVAGSVVSEVGIELGSVVDLPIDEIPQRFSIQTPENLLEVADIFALAQQGDAIVLYEQNETAILIRPPSNQIVAVRPVISESEETVSFGQADSSAAVEPVTEPEPQDDQSDNTQPQNTQPEQNPVVVVVPGNTSNDDQTPEPTTTTPAQEVAETISIAIRNGSGQSGVAGELASQLENDSALEIATIGNAANFEYRGLLVINLSGNKVAAKAQQIADQLGAGYDTALPEGEFLTREDIVIIIGS